MDFQFRAASNRLVDLSNPSVEDIDLEDMSHQLSLINRFNGATREGLHWNVAAHSILVAALCRDPEAYPYALLHDAHEAWAQDIISPMKKLIESIAGFDVVGQIADRFDARIAEVFNLQYPMPAHIKAKVKAADNRAFEIEQALFTSKHLGVAQFIPETSDPIVAEALALAGKASQSEEWFLVAIRDLQERYAPRMEMALGA